jgi:hypothetical protein
MFKRREAKKADIGHIVSIDRNTVERMSKSLDYMNNSASLHAKARMSTIRFNSLRSFGHKIFLADITLLYIKNSSSFGKGLVEAVPLAVNRDDVRGQSIKSLVSKKVKYTMHKDSLVFATNSDIASRIEHMGEGALHFIKNQMINKYKIDNFSWENR